MRLLKPSGLVPAIAVAVVALPTVAAGALPSAASAPARATANSVTFQDSTGEDPAAPDITSIVVSNTDAGMLSFQVSIPNRPTLGQDMLCELWVDSDNNPQTGSADFGGADYVAQLIRGEVNLYKWDGTDYTRRAGDPSAVTLSFSYANGVTFRISAAELGNANRLNFFVVAISGLVFDPNTGGFDDTNAVFDVAPGGGSGLYPYEVKITPATLVIRRVTTSPTVPRAGRTFTMRLAAARSDTGAVIQNGRVTCVGRAGTTRLRAKVARVTAGAATCTWTIPANAKGKTFRGSVTVAFEGLRASSSISRRIA